MRHDVITISRLHARRSETFALNIDRLEMSAGSILCVAGPNGSGKSTFISCLVGLLEPDAGLININGHPLDNDLRATKALMGYIPDDEEWFIKELSAREYIDLLESIYRDAGVHEQIKPRAMELAEKLYFNAFDQRLEHLSHGNKKKIQIITGLMHRPKIIVVDELRNGLDPLAIIAAEAIIKEEAAAGACVVAATHDLWWAQRVADTIVLLIDGKVAVEEAASHIVGQYGSVENLFVKKVRGQLAQR